MKNFFEQRNLFTISPEKLRTRVRTAIEQSAGLDYRNVNPTAYADLRFMATRASSRNRKGYARLLDPSIKEPETDLGSSSPVKLRGVEIKTEPKEIKEPVTREEQAKAGGLSVKETPFPARFDPSEPVNIERMKELAGKRGISGKIIDQLVKSRVIRGI